MAQVDDEDRYYVKTVDDALDWFRRIDDILQTIDNRPNYPPIIQQIINNLENIKSDRRLRTRDILGNVSRVTDTARKLFPYLSHYRTNRLKARMGFPRKHRTCGDLFGQLEEREYMLVTSLNSLQPLVYDPSNPENVSHLQANFHKSSTCQIS
ncbi:hypothetical protein RRF57_006762 [Xylaria bambusicola]|uniref:Uncharacterized protein n=1 Tax=Xylaria bambusicola TaxID=326684 RepID=A0AAN7ULQ7_9PEZI